jgi:ABC-type multidrug transport system ATPase subunit
MISEVNMIAESCEPPLAQETAAPLQIAGITKWYGEQRALGNVVFDVRAGEILGLIGPNGSGKTTLLEAVAGLLPVDAGSVFWRGSSLSRHHRREVVFYLPDGVRPWDGQPVIHVLEFFASVFGRRAAELDEVTRSVGLELVIGKRVCALSKGYARRLMLALALLTPHPVLLMDEPFDGFDIRQTREIMALMRRVAAHGRTLTLAIHQLADAERVCDRFILLADGRVCGVGSLDDLRARIGQATARLEDVFLALT